MKQINIVMLLPSLDTGGAESMAVQISKEINRNSKFNLIFICLSSSKGTSFEKELLKSGVEILFLNKRRGLQISIFFKVWKILSKYKIQIIHTHLGACLYTFPWVFLHKVKLLHTVHTTPKKELPFLHIKILKILYHRKKAFPIAISQRIKEQISEVYNLDKNLINVIYNPVNTKNFIPIEHKNTSKYITYVCVARLVEAKNHSMLIKAFSIVKQEIKNAVLILAGDGDLKLNLQNEVIQLKISESVKFLGNIDNIPKLLSHSDIFVLSSYYEGLPMTILEAMSSGLPIIATNVGGIPDIVKDNGILVESDNTEDLANAMIKLGKDEQLRYDMGKKGLINSKKYDINSIIKEYELLYEKYANKN